MSLSTSVESEVDSYLDTYGNTVVIQKQTSTYNTYNELADWTDSTTVNTKAIIKPWSTRRLSIAGEEWRLYEGGIINETDLVCFLKSSETIEQTTTTTVATRYLVIFDSERYYIVRQFDWKLQDNLMFKKCYIRKITT